VAAPCLDANRHRCAPALDQLTVAALLVAADEDRLMKDHAVDRDRRASAPRPLRRQTAAGQICESSHPPKMSPFGLASADMAMTRTSGSVLGNSTSDPSRLRLAV